MSRPRKPSGNSNGSLKSGKRITARPYAIGYAVVRPRKNGPGRWCTRIGSGNYLATPYNDVPGAEPHVRALLKQRIEAHLNPELAVQERKQKAIATAMASMTIRDLAINYEQERLKNARPEVVGKLHYAIKQYLDLDDPLDCDLITERIKEVQRTTALASPSQRDYLMSLRRMFDYAIEREWMEENPVRQLKKLPSSETQRRRGFTEKEMQAILSWHRGDHPKSPSTEVHWHRPGKPKAEPGAVPALRTLYLVRRFESLTAMRIGEILALRKDHVHNDHFEIQGKGAGNGPRPRIFPTIILPELRKRAKRKDESGMIARARLEWLEEIVSILNEAMAMPEKRGRRGMVFNVGRSTCDETMQRSRENCEIDIPAKHGSHSIRKYAIWFMREILRLPDPVQLELCGHDDDTAEEYYRQKRTPKEHARALWLD